MQLKHTFARWNIFPQHELQPSYCLLWFETNCFFVFFTTPLYYILKVNYTAEVPTKMPTTSNSSDDVLEEQLEQVLRLLFTNEMQKFNGSSLLTFN